MSWSSDLNLFRAEPMAVGVPLTMPGFATGAAVVGRGAGGGTPAGSNGLWAEVVQEVRGDVVSGTTGSASLLPPTPPAASFGGIGSIATGDGFAPPPPGGLGVGDDRFSDASPTSQTGGGGAGNGIDMIAAREQLRQFLESGSVNDPEVLAALFESLISAGPEYAPLADVVAQYIQQKEDDRLGEELVGNTVGGAAVSATSMITNIPGGALSPSTIMGKAKAIMSEDDTQDDE